MIILKATISFIDNLGVAVFSKDITKDDRVEIVATLLGAFILGASFARDFFLHGRFEIRIFFFGISSLILFISISRVAKINIQVFNPEKRLLSLVWLLFFIIGNYAALDLLKYQLLEASNQDIRFQTIVFLVCYTVSADLLYYLNKELLFDTLRHKTVYKYLLAPINGISLGVIITGIIVWSIS